MVRQTPLFHVYVHVLLALPSVLGAWSMALYVRSAMAAIYYRKFLHCKTVGGG